jgi:hypothetical protein
MYFKNLKSCFVIVFATFIASSTYAFEWRLNDIWLCGDTPFSTCDDFPALDSFIDDFDDGDRNEEPTLTLVDYEGSNVVESNGYLVFDASDGGIEIDLNDDSIPYVRDEVFVNILVPDNVGDGYTSLTAQFDSDISKLAIGGINDTSSGFGITFAGIYDTTSQGAQLGVFNSSISGCATLYFNDIKPGGFLTGFDVIDPACTGEPISGDIVLRLTLLQDTLPNPVLSGNNLLVPSYSLDGGATYVEYANWDSAASPDDGGFGSSYLIPISYDSAVATVFGQTSTSQLVTSEEFIPFPLWALGVFSGVLILIARFARNRI